MWEYKAQVLPKTDAFSISGNFPSISRPCGNGFQRAIELTVFPWEHGGYEGAIYTHSKTSLIVGRLCSWARLRWTAGDSYLVPTAPKEQALNYLKGKRAARLKIKEEKTFQRELFTGHDLRASDVPLQPGSQLQNVSLPVLSFLHCRAVYQT